MFRTLVFPSQNMGNILKINRKRLNSIFYIVCRNFSDFK